MNIKKTFEKKIARLLRYYFGLWILLFLITFASAVGVMGGVALLIGHLFHFVSEKAPDVETCVMLTIICSPSILLWYICFFVPLKVNMEELPKIAIGEAHKFLKDHPQYIDQLNPLIIEAKQKDNSSKLSDWLDTYKELRFCEKELIRITEQLEKLPREKTRLEAKIPKLKFKLGIS
jgi:hypothetical protein